MKIPDSFIPESFEPDPVSAELMPTHPAELASVPFLPTQAMSLPPLLAEKLNDAIQGGDPGVFLALFKRAAIISRMKTNTARVAEIGSVAALIQSYAGIYQQGIANQRLPTILTQQHQIQDATHKVALMQLSTAHKTAYMANVLVSIAASEGMTLELYLKKLDKALEAEHRQTEINQDLGRKEREKQIDREHERQDSENRIMLARLAKTETLQLMRQNRLEIDALHTQIDQIQNDGTKSDTLKQQLVTNRLKDLDALESQRDRLQEDLRKASAAEDAR